MECFAGWPYENARFLIRNIAGRNWAFVSEPWEENGRYLWKWSDAVEVREGLWYRLAVDYMVYDKDSVDFEDCAGIRCFRNRSDWKIRSAVGTFHIGRGEEVPEVNKVYHRIFCFQPGSQFIRIGIHLEKKRPHLYVTGFQLSEMSSEMRGGVKS